MKLWILVLLSMLMVSCGKDSALWPTETVITESVAPAVEEEYSYSFKQLSCTTGEHKSESFFSICEKLKDNKLNNDCAETKRKNLFVSAECTGSFN